MAEEGTAAGLVELATGSPTTERPIGRRTRRAATELFDRQATLAEANDG